jgi:hypothetical protein
MSEILSPFSVDARMSINVHIMVRSWIARIYVNKQASMIKNNCFIHNIDYFVAMNQVW